MYVNYDSISKEHSVIKEKLQNKYNSVIEKYRNLKSEDISSADSNYVWICWWQGLENAPEIVKKCFNSVKKYAQNKQVILITKENYNQYIEIPEYIEEKRDEGKISITHFSDILRVNLLSKYGGVWLDATCFLTSNIFDDLNGDFYSVKLPYNKEEKCVSQGKWCVFFMYGKKNNILFNFVRDFYNVYWKEEDSVIDYFLMDYIISIAYDNIDEIKYMIDKVPENNFLIHNLKEKLNEEFDEKEYNELIKINKIHKLAHERKYIKELNNGKETFYGYICRNF